MNGNAHRLRLLDNLIAGVFSLGVFHVGEDYDHPTDCVRRVNLFQDFQCPVQTIMENKLRQDTFTQFIISEIDLDPELEEGLFSLQSLRWLKTVFGPVTDFWMNALSFFFGNTKGHFIEKKSIRKILKDTTSD